MTREGWGTTTPSMIPAVQGDIAGAATGLIEGEIEGQWNLHHWPQQHPSDPGAPSPLSFSPIQFSLIFLFSPYFLFCYHF